MVDTAAAVVVKAFVCVPVAGVGWEFPSDQYGRTIMRMPDPRAALGAIRIHATDGSKLVNLTIETVYGLADGSSRLVMSGPTRYPAFAPNVMPDCQFTRAIRITLPPSDLDKYDLFYSGVRSYYKQNVQDTLPSVPSGSWLGRESGGAAQEWLSLIEIRLTRRYFGSKQKSEVKMQAPKEPPAPAKRQASKRTKK